MNTKLRQNFYELYKFMNFCNLTIKNEKKNISELSQTYMEFYGCHGKVKNDGHTIDLFG